MEIACKLKATITCNYNVVFQSNGQSDRNNLQQNHKAFSATLSLALDVQRMGHEVSKDQQDQQVREIGLQIKQ